MCQGVTFMSVDEHVEDVNNVCRFKNQLNKRRNSRMEFRAKLATDIIQDEPNHGAKVLHVPKHGTTNDEQIIVHDSQTHDSQPLE